MDPQKDSQDLISKNKEYIPKGFTDIIETREDDSVFPIFEQDPTKDTIIVIIGGSGSGKDVVMGGVIKEEIGYHVKTATIRKKREGEDENTYTWMRQRSLDETEEIYYENLIKEYDLLESDAHDGNFYGLPRVNLAEALEEHKNDGKTPILRMEINGARRIIELFGQAYNILVVGIKPDCVNGFERAIRHRDKENKLSYEEIEVRIREASQKQALNDELSHFTLTNVWGTENIQRTIDALCELIMNIIGD